MFLLCSRDGMDEVEDRGVEFLGGEDSVINLD